MCLMTEFSARDPIIQVRDFDDNHNEEEKWELEQESYDTESNDSESKTSMPVRPSYSAATDSGTLRAWRTLLRQHLSDPGPPSLLLLKVSDKKISSSSPIPKGGLPHEKHQAIDDHQGLLRIDTNEQLMGDFGRMTRAILSRTLGSKAFLKWMFIVLNVGVEACQAALTQEAAQGKLGRQIYLKLSIVTSSVCLMMSLVEAFHEGRSNGLVWLQKSFCCWFYYPGLRGRLFGRFSVYFGIICSMVQLFFNSIAKVTGKDFVKFDYVPLLLSICYLAAAMIASREKTFLATVKCESHGYNAAEATTVDGHGHWVFECPKCQMDKYP